ncbi:septum site-determining protein MinC [Lacrimispora sp. NSJ-141]|uniref:Probable septum site-determining protein MinC n=1 Tax=Lientehia hominis TaxID=2897778 RepID=A0AAP2RHM2_9FIRM|nr:septum site-determining protein MinC [Lientehia hominis]MCD2491048.1 septum site-determining protein MinC [Lientehia hominis]
MRQTVIIKGNNYGLSVFLDPEVPMDKLLEDITAKFRDSAKFFRGAKMAVTFEGRTLTPEETNQIVNTICENSEIDISCVIDTDKAREAFFRRTLEEEAEEEGDGKPVGSGQFYKGTLRSGQVLEAEGNIVILGDVNPGARIVAKGNIIVLGTLRGTAIAGLGGKKHAIVVALEMEPIQIRIGDVTARTGGRHVSEGGAQIAYLDFGKIYIEPLCKEVIDEVSFR